MEEQTYILSNRLDQIESVQDEVKYVLQTRGVRLKQIHAILLALGEWLENVVLHAYTDDKEHRIDIALSVSEDEVELSISDDGRDFDLTTVPSVDRLTPSDRRSIQGQGLHLIRSLMDRVEHHRQNGRNQVVMAKQIIPLT